MHASLISFGTSGGEIQYPAQLTNALSETIDVTVFGPDVPEFRELCTSEVTLRLFDTDLLALTRIVKLNRWLRRQHRTAGIDVAHFPFYRARGVLTLPFIKTLSLPVVATIHDPTYHSGQRNWFRERIVQLSTRSVEKIIVHGDRTKTMARDAGFPPEKLNQVPHGLYDHFRRPKETDPTEEPRTILFFGNMRWNKGFDRIPHILELVAEEVPDVQTIVAGSPEGLAAEQRGFLDELRSSGRVELHDDFIPNDEVHQLFKRASVVVLPYRDATQSGVAMIAYTFETPIVATDTGDLGTMVERDKTGLLADPASDEAIASMVIKMLTNDELRATCRSRIQNVQSKYSWQTIAGEIIDIYQSINRVD